MKARKNNRNINPNEKVCYNCKHMLWMVGIGMGVRCNQNKIDGLPQMIPHLQHTCNCFKNKNEHTKNEVSKDWHQIMASLQKYIIRLQKNGNNIPAEIQMLLEEQKKLKDIWDSITDEMDFK